MIIDVEAVPHTARAITWTGTFDDTETDEIANLIGPEKVNTASSVLQICDIDGRWIDMHPGWTVVVKADGSYRVSSREAYRDNYRQLQPA